MVLSLKVCIFYNKVSDLHHYYYYHYYDQQDFKCFPNHFLAINGRSGFPLFEVFLGVVGELPAGTVRDSIVTLASRIKLSKVSCSALRRKWIFPPSPDR